MNRVQELIDVNKDKLPTGLAKELLEACKEEADATPKLFSAVVTRFNCFMNYNDEGDPNPFLHHNSTQTLILESITRKQAEEVNRCIPHLVEDGMILDDMATVQMPIIFTQSDTEKVVLHDIKPYVPQSQKKRARSD